MGEVYLALDRNLGRQVAIKILPAEFSTDPERLARFEREAKLLATLNHPNIAAVYGFEEANGLRFLVLELVEGETLQTRLARGTLPMDEALETCRQVAEGLEAAHERGVVHRDLKPGNIMITPEGKVKVLDFGLARAYTGETTGIDIANSPT
ncbi:MAG: serine/threonine-protein kinase, partial [Candidatus Aminicenantes bacterium]|nr:serine/threonine-protein kinase [Candidatus Aminicenantes bacterium]